MRVFHTLLLYGLSTVFLHAMDPAYEAEFQRTLKIYPPGDYNAIPVRRFVPVLPGDLPKVSPTFGLLKPVEPSDKDIKTLFSDAAIHFCSGRLDLAMTLYKQALVLDPDNKDAKANLYDIVFIRSLWDDELHRSEASKWHAEISERLFKDIMLSKEHK